MRSLYLLRHGKSSWKDESLADFERPLARRGVRACGVTAAFIAAQKIEVDLILSSTAVRTRESIELIQQQAKLRKELRFDERLYGASASRILEIVREIENDHKVVLIVAHNPGLVELLNSITSEQEDFPTAGLAKIRLKGTRWSAFDLNSATLEWMVRPRELERG